MLEVSICGTTLRISLLFPATLFFLLCFDTTGLAAVGFSAAIVHECGHLTALLACGGRPSCLHFSFFGMNMTVDPAAPLSYYQTALVAAAGPLVNLACALVLKAVGAAACFVLPHIALLLLNLLPTPPFDGEQLLRAMLSSRFSPLFAARMHRIVYVVSCAVLLTGGVALLVFSGYNFTLLAVGVYMTLWPLLSCGFT